MVRLVVLPRESLTALVDSDFERAGAEVGLVLPPYFLEMPWLWRYRLDQVTADPLIGRWLVRATVRSTDDVVLGHAGFHGPPDDAGMVEVGYSIAPEHRGRRYAQAALDELLRYAVADPEVRTVRATVGPDNDASLAIIHGFGFVHVGEQMNEIDGLELVFERSIGAADRSVR